MEEKVKVFLFVDPEGNEFLSNACPRRVGKTKVKNLQKALGYSDVFRRVNNFKGPDEMIEVSGFLGYNTLWDHGDDWELPGFEITLSDCFKWSRGVKIPQGTIELLIGKKITWNDESIEYTGRED